MCGTRIKASKIIAALSGGDLIEDVLMDYTSLYSEDLYAVHA